MFWHWQDVSGDDGRRRFMHARAWVHWGGLWEKGWRACFEWAIGWTSLGVQLWLRPSCENEVTVGISFIVASVWLSLSPPSGSFLQRLMPAAARDVVLSADNESVRLVLWGHWGAWNSRDPWWVRGVSWRWADMLLGRWQRRVVGRELGTVRLCVDGRGIKVGRCEVREEWTGRPRWFKKHAFVTEVTFDRGVFRRCEHRREGYWRFACEDKAKRDIDGAIIRLLEAIASEGRDFLDDYNRVP